MREVVLTALITTAVTMLATSRKAVVAWLGTPGRRRAVRIAAVCLSSGAVLVWLGYPAGKEVVVGPPPPFVVQFEFPIQGHDAEWHIPRSHRVLDEHLLALDRDPDGYWFQRCVDEARAAWLQAQGASLWGYSTIEVIVISRTDVPVLLREVVVEARAVPAPRSGTYARFCDEQGGPDETPQVRIQLDKPSEQVVLARQGSLAEPEDVIRDFTYSIEPHQTEVFNLSVQATTGAWEWGATLEFIVDGEKYPVKVDDPDIVHRLVGLEEASASAVWSDIVAADRLREKGALRYD